MLAPCVKYGFPPLLGLALWLLLPSLGGGAEIALPSETLGLGSFRESVRDLSNYSLLPPQLTASAPTLSSPGQDEIPLSLDKVGGIAALRLSTETPVSPYVGAGLSKNDPDQESVLETFARRDEGVRYQLGAGIGVDLGKSTRLGLDYRYTPAADSSLLNATTPEEVDDDRHRISFGLEFLF